MLYVAIDAAAVACATSIVVADVTVEVAIVAAVACAPVVYACDALVFAVTMFFCLAWRACSCTVSPKFSCQVCQVD